MRQSRRGTYPIHYATHVSSWTRHLVLTSASHACEGWPQSRRATRSPLHRAWVRRGRAGRRRAGQRRPWWRKGGEGETRGLCLKVNKTLEVFLVFIISSWPDLNSSILWLIKCNVPIVSRAFLIQNLHHLPHSIELSQLSQVFFWYKIYILATQYRIVSIVSGLFFIQTLFFATHYRIVSIVSGLLLIAIYH